MDTLQMTLTKLNTQLTLNSSTSFNFYPTFYDLIFTIRFENFSSIASKIILEPKKMISTALMKENPVRSPNVPPIAESISTILAALSFSILSNVVAPK